MSDWADEIAEKIMHRPDQEGKYEYTRDAVAAALRKAFHDGIVHGQVMGMEKAIMVLRKNP